MNKNKCDIIYDLLPLYAENICSEASKKAVAKHISECRKMLDKMNKSIEISVDNDINTIKKIRLKIVIKRIVAVFISAIAVFLTCFGLFVYEMIPVELEYIGDGLENYIRVETDDSGNVWIGRTGKANTGFLCDVRKSADGRFFSYNFDYDGSDPVGFDFNIVKEHYKTISAFDVSVLE